MSTTKRKARTPRKPRATAVPVAVSPTIVTPEAGQAIGQALGRTLADLLRENQTSGASVGVGTYIDSVIGFRPRADAGESPFGPERDQAEGLQFGGAVGEAMARVLNALDNSIGVTQRERALLAPVLSPPQPAAGSQNIASGPYPKHNIAQLLHGIADRLNEDSRDRIGLLDRLEI